MGAIRQVVWPNRGAIPLQIKWERSDGHTWALGPILLILSSGNLDMEEKEEFGPHCPPLVVS